MSSASEPTTPPLLPRPSVFISYASEDRAPTRLLREALANAGLDVWYDENELGGGDAWDQKIRRQIRDCTYFMPVVSATTERRREGYFRREWRLATDRSLDMADDVMFLVPVVIDGTSESKARVPEKFLTVQWLRLPGGQPTPALAVLAERLLAHDHAVPPPTRATLAPPSQSRPPQPASTAAPSTPAPDDGPPQLPPFPKKPTDSHHKPKWVLDVIWWYGTWFKLTFKRLPRAVRALILLWLVSTLIFRGCTTETETKKRAREHPPASPKVETGKTDPDEDEENANKAIQTATEKLDQAANAKDASKLGAGFARAGAEIMRAVQEEINSKGAARELVGMVPFDTGVTDTDEAKFARQVSESVFGELSVAKAGRVRPLPLTDATATDEQRREVAVLAGESHFVSARMENATEGGGRLLVVRLYAVKTPDPLWSGSYALTGNDVSTASNRIAQAILTNLPKPAAK